jgi:hypothetical protein
MASVSDAGMSSILTDMSGRTTTTGRRDIKRTWKDHVVSHLQLGGINIGIEERGNEGNQRDPKMIDLLTVVTVVPNYFQGTMPTPVSLCHSENTTKQD